MNITVILVGVLLLAGTFVLSILYSSFDNCSRSRLQSFAGERRRLPAMRKVLPRLSQTGPLLMILKYLAELVLTAFIFMAPHLVGKPTTFGVYEIAVQVLVAAAAVVVICEIIPRSIGEKRGEEIVLMVGRPAQIVALAAWPIAWLQRVIDEIVGRLLPPHPALTPGDELADDVIDAVIESEPNGDLKPDERDMILSVISFREVDVAEIMTPRTEMVGVEKGATAQQAIEMLLQHGFSRLPVYGTSRDNILGVVHIKDLIREIRQNPNRSLSELAVKPYFVPETKQIAELLREFQAQKLHFAIVVDEYGGTAGVVTIEDIVEEIVGEIDDEYDSKTRSLMRNIDEHTVEADGRCRIDDLNDGLHVQIPEDAEYDTVGGFVVSTLGHIPKKGEVFRHKDVSFAILEVDERRVKRVRIQVPPEPLDDEP